MPDSQAYYWATIEHMTSGLFVIAYLVLYYLLFSQWIALTFIIEGIVIATLTYYLHAEYGKSKSWLNHYSWFRKDRKLHQIHHSHFNDRFMKSKNYSFGGATGYLIDRLFRTFQDINNINLQITED